jgi:hypothetical protein
MPTAPVVDPTHVFYFLAVVFLTGLVGAAAFGCFQTLPDPSGSKAASSRPSASVRLVSPLPLLPLGQRGSARGVSQV